MGRASGVGCFYRFFFCFSSFSSNKEAASLVAPDFFTRGVGVPDTEEVATAPEGKFDLAAEDTTTRGGTIDTCVADAAYFYSGPTTEEQ